MFHAHLKCLIFPLLAALASFSRAQGAELPVSSLKVPPGFHVEVLTDQVPNARAMSLGRFADGHGVLYVGTMDAGKVYAVELSDYKARGIFEIAHGLKLPAGVVFHDGDLYVSAVSRILRFAGIDQSYRNSPTPLLVTDQLPSDLHHGAKYLGFGPDGLLYVASGSPCNVCAPDSNRYGNIARMQPDGSHRELVAVGIRNSVGFDWSPIDRSLWLTDNGRDNLGDELPSDKLNHVTRPQENFGFPYCHQGNLPDPEFGSQHACSEFTAPVANLGPHVASLGMRFYNGAMFPPEFRNNIFIAEHGSWNRSTKIGYRVARVVVDTSGHLMHQEVFAEGWLQHRNGGEKVWGRPADVLVLPDGSLLVSDDFAGAVYRITYSR